MARLARANQLGDGVFKLVRHREVGGVAEFAVSRAAGYTAEQYARGFRICTASVARAGSLYGVKSLAYLENLLAKRAAQAEGFDEVVFADTAGNPLECAGCNLFVVVGGRVFTPPAGEILPGVARSVVLEICGAQVEERPLAPGLLAEAEEVFLTNAIMGVMPVAEWGERRFAVAHCPVTRRISAEFAARQRASL